MAGETHQGTGVQSAQPTSTGRERENEDKGHNYVYVAVCTICTVALLLGLSAFLFKVVIAGDDSDGGGSATYITESTTAGHSGSMVTNSSTTTKMTPTKPPATDPPTTYSLICTVQAYHPGGPNIRIKAPPDGVCDFFFYESLYYDGTTDVLKGAPWKRMTSFTTLASRSHQTQCGFSIEALYIDSFNDDFNLGSGKQHTRVIMLQKIFHYGFLTLNITKLDPTIVTKALRTLENIARYLEKESAGKRKPYSFLGFYGLQQKDCRKMATQIKSSSFKPHAIVLRGHLPDRDNKIKGCRILPPNVYTIPTSLQSSLNYARPFADTCDVAQCLKAQLGTTMAISVSVTMKGRIYKPKTPDPAVSSIGNYGLYSECEQGNYVQEIGPLSICDNATYTSNLAINNTYQAVVAFSKVAGYTLVFDNSITLLKKVCGAKKNLTNVDIGLTIFDADHDNGTTKCQPNVVKGNGDRIRIVKKALMYFRDEYKDASKEVGCNSLT